MKILSRVANLKNYLAYQYSDKNSPDSSLQPKAQLPPAKEDRIEKSQTATLDSEGQSYLATANKGGEIVQWSPAMQSLLEEPPSNLPMQLMVGGIIFCLSFGVWAWFGEIEKTGKAQGRLVPKGETYKIESLDSAKVSQIMVEEGDRVKAGQLIAELDSEGESKEVERLSNSLDALKIELEQKQNLLENVKLEGQTNKLVAQAEVRSQQSAIDSAFSKIEVTNQRLEQLQSEMLATLARKEKTQQLSGLDQEKLAQINADLTAHQERLEKLKP